MRRHVLLLTFLGGCCGGPPPPLDVRTPGALTTLAELQALHDPPRVEVEKTRIQPGLNSRFCDVVGGPLCFAAGAATAGVLPLILLLASEREYDEVVVRGGAEVLYLAHLDTSGRFVSAVDRRGGIARQLGIVSIPRLGAYVVIERARGPLAAPGSKAKDGPFVRTAVTPQYDVAAVCLPALPRRSEGEERGWLIAECGAALGEEAGPFFASAFGAARDDTKASALTLLCKLTDSPEARDAALDALVTPGPLTARAGVACALGGVHTLPFFRAVLAEACTAEGADGRALVGVLGAREGRVAAVTDALPALVALCENASRRVLLGAVVGSVPDSATLAAALAGADPLVGEVIAVLDVGHRGVRTALLGALGTTGQAEPIVNRLFESAVLSPEDASAFVQAYAANDRLGPRAVMLSALRERRFTTRAWAPLVKAESRAKAGSDESAALRVGLIALGKREYAAAVAGVLHGYSGDVSAVAARDSLQALVAYGLVVSGCTLEQVKKLADAPRAPSTARGALCTKAPI